MPYEVATWISALLLIIPALLYAYIALKDAKQQQKEKKS